MLEKINGDDITFLGVLLVLIVGLICLTSIVIYNINYKYHDRSILIEKGYQQCLEDGYKLWKLKCKEGE